LRPNSSVAMMPSAHLCTTPVRRIEHIIRTLDKWSSADSLSEFSFRSRWMPAAGLVVVPIDSE